MKGHSPVGRRGVGEEGMTTRNEIRCQKCGYGAVVEQKPLRCPMCGAGSWIGVESDSALQPTQS